MFNAVRLVLNTEKKINFSFIFHSLIYHLELNVMYSDSNGRHLLDRSNLVQQHKSRNPATT